MRCLQELLRLNKQIRVMGFDDAPFDRNKSERVKVSGIVCADTQFEGMVWNDIEQDGLDATLQLANMLVNSKFHPQVAVILLDGIALGGFNIVDLPELSSLTAKPCIAVMRKQPDLESIDKALQNFDDHQQRMELIKKAGVIHQQKPFVYQTAGCDADVAGQVLERLTSNGNVPEALRLAHLIGAAVMTGQSSNRA